MFPSKNWDDFLKCDSHFWFGTTNQLKIIINMKIIEDES